MTSSQKAKSIFLNDRYYLEMNEFNVFEKISVDDFIEYSKKTWVNYPSIRSLEDSMLLVEKENDNLEINPVQTEIPFGNYILKRDYNISSMFLDPVSEIYSDKYIEINSESTAKIGSNLEKFLSLEEKYKELQLIHKRGYLLYGPPGNGKTMTIKHLVERYQDSCYVLYIRKSTDWEKLSSIRSKFKDSTVFFIIEELTLQTMSSDIDELLNFLDGSFSWNNCVVFATTNTPELLPNNIIDRPSRFDMVIKFDNPTDDCRKQYITHMIGECSDRMVRLSQGHSLAYLKELCLMSLIYDDFDASKFGNNFKVFQDYIESTKTKHYV